jgi:tight adherence protein B
MSTGKVKKEKKPPGEPQYYLSSINTPVLNYKVYYLSKREKILYFALGFVVGAAVGYLFYGGIGVDEFGNPTMLTLILNVVVCCVTGFIAGRFCLPIFRNRIISKRKRALNTQFRDMLEALSTSIGAGKNVTDSFRGVFDDMKIQYEEDAYIVNELGTIIAGLDNNINIEDMLRDFGERSGNDDIRSFANVFEICFRKGGNINDTIRSTHEILGDKMEIAEDIETAVTSNKMEQNIMIIMPVLLIGMIKFMSPEFGANFVSPTGLVSSTVAIALFVAAYIVGKQILDIKI